MTDYISRSDEELRQLAMDIVDGRVFTSDQLRADDFRLARMIFMPIGFADEATVDAWKDNQITMFYEHLSQAGDRAINGYPMFMSVRVVSKPEHLKLLDMVARYGQMKKQFSDLGE